ncbi:hypothetical protein [Streptomyces sp. NPDC007883]|uniref:hypothetical protein n=1 Tax=Streptomyces sp. NPDC007883 TaxID=3155116 RepID=UPI0033F634B1
MTAGEWLMYPSMHSRTEFGVGGADVPSQTAAATTAGAPSPGDAREPRGSGAGGASAPSRRWPYALGGVLLLLMFLGMCVLGALMATSCYELIREGSGLYELYLQSALFAGMGFISLCALPAIAERNCVGRFIARRIPV